MNGSQVYNYTGCRSACRKTEYQISSWTEVTSEDYEQVSMLELKLQMHGGRHEVKEEYVIYDFNTFIADVGGFLGLLLGHSLLSVYHFAGDNLKKLNERKCY